MQILTETPTEDGQYVAIWAAMDRLWCNQIKIENGCMFRRIASNQSPLFDSNWESAPSYEGVSATFLKL